MRIRPRALACTLLLSSGLAACGDGGTDPNRLTPQDVAEIYQVCTLVFQPENTALKAVDIRTAAFEVENPNVRQPQVQVSASQVFRLVFTPKGDFVERDLQGTFTIPGNRVRFAITGGTATREAYLLPANVEFNFQASPKSLSTSASATYDARRADYARLAGVSESGLAETIPGRLSASLRVGSCR